MLVRLFLEKKPDPDHCYNQVQDEGEQGVDCGGPCSSRCQYSEPIETLWIKLLSQEDKNHLVALVKNPNNLYGISEFSYRFIGKDDKGSVVLDKKGIDFILPQESKYLFELAVGDLFNIDNIDLELEDLIWQKFSSYKAPTLLIVNKEMKNINESGFLTEVSGRLINDSVYNLRTVNIKVVLFDNQDEIIGINRTYLDDVGAKEKRDFRVFWKQLIENKNVKRIEIIPETNIFKHDNFIKDYSYERAEIR